MANIASFIVDMASSYEDVEKVGNAFTALNKAINTVSNFNNLNMQLDMINEKFNDQIKLQDKIYAAANRASSGYTDMAKTITKLEFTNDGLFSNGNETLAFTELMYKSFIPSSGGEKEREASVDKFTDSLISGNIGGEDLSNIAQNAPIMLDAIMEVTGLPLDKLEELANKGEFTSDIIKNAMFLMSDEINDKFNNIPITFVGILNKVKNSLIQGFSPLLILFEELLKSDTFTGILNTVFIGIFLISNVIEGLVNLITQYWPYIDSILGAIVIYLSSKLLPGFIQAGIAGLISGIQIAAGWVLANAPMLLIIATIAVIIFALTQAGITVRDIFGFIGGVIGLAIASIWNIILFLFEGILMLVNIGTNKFAVFANFLANVFSNPVSSIIYLFQGLADIILGTLESIATGIDFLFGSNLAKTVSGWRSGLKDMADEAVEKYAPNDNYEEKIKNVNMHVDDFGGKRMSYEESYNKGFDIGTNIYDGTSDIIGNFLKPMDGPPMDMSGIDPSKYNPMDDPSKHKQPESNSNKNNLTLVDILNNMKLGMDLNNTNEFDMSLDYTKNDGVESEINNYNLYESNISEWGTSNTPLVVEGTGSGGSVNVDMPDEDISFLREIAERDYIANIASNSLAPNISIKFGDVHENADAEKLAGRIQRILQDEIAIASEGVY